MIDELCGEYDVSDCDLVVPQTESTDPIVVFALGFFPSISEPVIQGAAFGVDYDACIDFLDWRACGDWERTELGWPESGTATAVLWFDPQPVPDRVFSFYRFTAQVEADASGEWRVTPNPIYGAVFSDGVVDDPIAALGTFGFNTDGFAPCPVASGACCLDDGVCELLLESDCQAMGGIFLGDGTTCEPGSCQATPTIQTSWGRIKSNARD